MSKKVLLSLIATATIGATLINTTSVKAATLEDHSSDTYNIQNEQVNSKEKNTETQQFTISTSSLPQETSDIFLANKKSRAPLVRIAPDPTGRWTRMATLKYKINPTQDAQVFGFAAISYLGTDYVAGSKAAAAIASGVSAVFSSKIKGRDIWVTVHREKKDGKYVLLSRQRFDFYSNSSRTRRIKSVTITARIVKRTKYARRYKISRSESPFSTVY